MKNRFDMPAIEEITGLDQWRVHKSNRSTNQGAGKADIKYQGRGQISNEKLLADATDSIITYDSVDDMADDWTDAPSIFRNRLRQGDDSLVHLAEPFIEAMREHIFIGKSHRVIDNVLGAVPNVPAYLAGNPYNMRLRQRTTSVKSPMCLFVELTGSAGTMARLNERGAMLYALASILNEIRPIQLWATMTYGGGKYGTTSGTPRLQQHAVRLDTAPFDVARICNVLMHADTMATYAYQINKKVMGNWEGGWAYGVPGLEKKWAGEILARIVHPGTTVLYIPAAHLYDPLVSTPIDWLKGQLDKYAGDIIEAA